MHETKKTMTSVRNLIHKTDPYLGFSPNYDSEVRGWNCRHPKLAELIREIKPSLIVEVGSWMGGSALWMAEHTSAEIVCIDTWTGAREMWTNTNDPDRYGALKHENGYPTIYRDFLSNVVKAGKQDQITPFPVPSSVGLPALLDLGVKPDLIYIDGDHSFNSVRMDIGLSTPLWPTVICGDDFYSWPQVGEAVKKSLPTYKVDEHGFWWFSRDMMNANAAAE